MYQKSRFPIIDDDWFMKTLVQEFGDRFPMFQHNGVTDPLHDLEEYESILFSLEKQDLILIVKIIQTFSTTVSPKRALHALVKRLTDVLDVSHSSLIFIDLEENSGTVAISHENPDFEGVYISLERYPEILRSLKTGEITIVKNPSQDPLMVSLQKDQIRKIRDVSIMVLPLTFQGKVFGTLLVRKQRSEEGFSIREVRICQLMVHIVLRFLQRLCNVEGVALRKGRGEPANRAAEGGVRSNKDDVFHSMLFSSVPVGVLILDGEGNICRANRKASEITVLSPEALVRMRFSDIVPENWINDIRVMRRGTGPEGDGVSRYHFPYTSPGGEKRNLSVERVSFPDEEPFSWVFFRDVSTEKQLENRLQKQKTELQETNERLNETRAKLLNRYEDLRRTNERLEELNKIKTHFLAVATHEIRTPLSVIIGYNNFLLQERAGKLLAGQKKILSESVESGERLLNIVNEMLDFSRIETGSLDLHLKENDILVLVERVHRQMKIIADKAKIDFRLRLPEGCVSFLHDPDRIEQVLVNLISNAIKFTPEGGRITLSAGVMEEDGKGILEVSVADNGRGLSAAMMEKIFAEGQPFVAHPVVPLHRKGVGLGLAISRRIVEAHKGRIWAESREGEGATFTFRLPFPEGGGETHVDGTQEA
jgi:PAS domain S-box-containing protein